MESTGQAKAEAQSRAEAAKIEGEAAVEQAKLKAEASKIEAVSSNHVYKGVNNTLTEVHCLEYFILINAHNFILITAHLCCYSNQNWRG